MNESDGGTTMSNKEWYKSYKEMLIHDILEWAGDRFTREYLIKLDTRTLERIYDNC